MCGSLDKLHLTKITFRPKIKIDFSFKCRIYEQNNNFLLNKQINYIVNKWDYVSLMQILNNFPESNPIRSRFSLIFLFVLLR